MPRKRAPASSAVSSRSATAAQESTNLATSTQSASIWLRSRLILCWGLDVTFVASDWLASSSLIFWDLLKQAKLHECPTSLLSQGVFDACFLFWAVSFQLGKLIDSGIYELDRVGTDATWIDSKIVNLWTDIGEWLQYVAARPASDNELGHTPLYRSGCRK